MQLYKVFLRQRWYDSVSDANRLSVLSVLQLKVSICLMYRNIGVLFLQASVLFVWDHLTLVLSLLTLIPICVQLSGLLNCSRELLVISKWDIGNLGYELKKVFVLRVIRNDSMGAGVVLVTARSGVV